jgi:hypothetical protein
MLEIYEQHKLKAAVSCFKQLYCSAKKDGSQPYSVYELELGNQGPIISFGYVQTLQTLRTRLLATRLHKDA